MAHVHNRIEKALMLLTVLSAAMFAAAVYLGIHGFHSTRNLASTQASQENLVAQLVRFARIQQEMGYTRFIHNYKNGVLRRDVDKLRQAQGNLTDALAALDDLVKLNGGLATEAGSLRATLIQYRNNADHAARLIRFGFSPTAIDEEVKIDDRSAVADLTRLAAAIDETHHVLRGQIAVQIDARRDVAKYDYFTAAVLLVFGVVLIWLLVTVRRQVRALAGARDTLMRIETRFGQGDDVVAMAAGPDNALPEMDLEQKITAMTARIEKQQGDLLRHADALASANEELERFAYVASHDLQEPLRKIQSNIDLIGLKGDDDLDEDVAKYLHRVTRSAEQMRQLIRDLLEYSRRGTQPLNMAPFHLRAMLEDIAIRSGGASTVPDGGITLDVDPDDLMITGDGSMIAQVFANLFENSRKYARPDVPQNVRVHAVMDDGGVVITVTDNGIGFDQKHAEDIFKPFIRLHGKSETSGTGIGLSIVKRVIERHGGTVEAQGEPEAGAVFTLRLPAAVVSRAADADTNNQEMEAATVHA